MLTLFYLLHWSFLVHGIQAPTAHIPEQVHIPAIRRR